MIILVNKIQESARGVALKVLQEVFEKGAYSNIALNRELQISPLSKEDRSLVTELVYGTVARKITLEWYLAHEIEDREQLDSWVYHLLLLSLYQILYLDKIPHHAIVYEAVNIAKKARGTDRFVNAVLRSILSKPLPDITAIKRKNKRLSIQYSVPVWLVSSLIEEYGQKRTEAILSSLFIRNKASVRVTDIANIESLAARLQAEKSVLSPFGLTKTSGHFAGSQAFKDGLIAIQDETSQLVAPTLNIEGWEEVLDACAAPGGKTCHIASYLDTGHVTALDLYDHKLDLIEENAQRLGVGQRVQTQKLDACQVAQTFGSDYFDKILVDAPCSGIGLIRRKPDIKYNKESADFDQLQKIQLSILDSVCQTLKKGGIITYSTCTIVRKENQEVIAKFLESHPNFEQVPLSHECTDILQDGCILITPEQYLTDGFFISQVRRKS